MKSHAGSMLRFASPLKAWSQRFTLALLIGASVALMLLDRADSIIIERTRTAIVDAISPILDVLSRPVSGAAEILENVSELANLREENARLHEDRARLLQWQSVARELDAQNQALRELLNLVPNPRARFISARVIGNTAGPFVRSALVTAGYRDGARKGQAVMTGEGFAGRVSEVGRRSARILLLTDINSRIPVLVERTRERAVLAGDNTNFPHLLYLPPNSGTAPGDRIVTSGHGGIFPPGLPVGVVSSAGEDGISVQPFVDWSRVEYVRLVDYELPGILLSPSGHRPD
jgi:rod shape-determining protein MreC